MSKSLAMMNASRSFVFLAKLALRQQRIMPITIHIHAARFARRMSAAIGALGLIAGRVIGIATMRLRIRLSIAARVFLTAVKTGVWGRAAPI